MKEQYIIHLGFERHDVTAEQSGHEYYWYYYTYEFTRGFELITCDSDEAERIREWYVEFLEAEQQIRFTDASELQDLMDLITEAKQ